MGFPSNISRYQRAGVGRGQLPTYTPALCPDASRGSQGRHLSILCSSTRSELLSWLDSPPVLQPLGGGWHRPSLCSATLRQPSPALPWPNTADGNVHAHQHQPLGHRSLCLCGPGTRCEVREPLAQDRP